MKDSLIQKGGRAASLCLEVFAWSPAKHHSSGVLPLFQLFYQLRQGKKLFGFAKAGKTPRRSGNTHRESLSRAPNSRMDHRRFAEAKVQPDQQGHSTELGMEVPNCTHSGSQNLLEAAKTQNPKCLGGFRRGKRGRGEIRLKTGWGMVRDTQKNRTETFSSTAQKEF